MKKIIIYCLLNLSLLNTLWAIPEYPLSKGREELFLTGNETLLEYNVIWGKHQNLAISPNYFDAFGIKLYSEDYKKKDRGYFLFKVDVNLSLLETSVSTNTDNDFYNFSILSDLSFIYLFDVFIPLDGLKLYVGPELTPGYQVGYFDGIYNIMAQSYFYCNFGLNLKWEYEINPTFHAGMDLYSFIVGFDYGRSGYNKDFMDDLTLTNWSNYNRGKYKVYINYDLSRTEVIGLSYSHNFLSVTDTEYDVIDGVHSVGLMYTRRLVR